MEQKYYTSERNQQILISLLKQHNIRKIVASPGATNITFVGSVMNDPWFEVFSSVDERSAAYIACGMAAESGEPVVLSCTGATASRNYVPALTEAYYRKLPVLAVTATQNINRIGHMMPQVIDRSVLQNDICVHSEHIATCCGKEDEWDATIRINRAILALSHHGGGPVHLNMTTSYSRDYTIKELPCALKISRFLPKDTLPALPEGRIAIAVGNHKPWNTELLSIVDKFCEKYGAVVFCEHASNYIGRYRVFNPLVHQQKQYISPTSSNCAVVIHIGEVTGYGSGCFSSSNEVWRVSEDGELRDTFHKLKNVFEMTELDFFTHYAAMDVHSRKDVGERWLKECHSEYTKAYAAIPELPFSNIWIAKQIASRIPDNSILHLGILNSLRSWDMFDVPQTVAANGFVNTGGFGIDGCMSSCIGGALVQPDKLHYLVLGDLSFFYDLNSIANRHIGNNIRILLINNGKGAEFRIYSHPGAAFGEEADRFIAAAGHYGNKSPQLVRHYAEDLGYEYLTASCKEEFLNQTGRFLSDEITERPIIFEVFTSHQDESYALEIMDNLLHSAEGMARQMAKKILPESVVNKIRKIR